MVNVLVNVKIIRVNLNYDKKEWHTVMSKNGRADSFYVQDSFPFPGKGFTSLLKSYDFTTVATMPKSPLQLITKEENKPPYKENCLLNAPRVFV